MRMDRRLAPRDLAGELTSETYPNAITAIGDTCQWKRSTHGRSARSTAALMLAAALLPISLGLAGCGSGSTDARNGAAKARGRPAPGGEEKLLEAISRKQFRPTEEKKLLEALVRRELAYFGSASGPTLARVSLSGGEAITIVAVRCGLAEASYRFAKYREEPARHARAAHGRLFVDGLRYGVSPAVNASS